MPVGLNLAQGGTMADIIYVRCPNSKCTATWSVPQKLWEQFHCLKCTVCGGFLDRRRGPTGATPEPIRGVTADDIKLLGDMRIAWEVKDAEQL